MPHVNSGGGDDLASTDEVKVYTDEGDEGERSSENLSEDKLGLVTETEEEKSPSELHGNGYGEKSSGTPQDVKPPDPHAPDRPGGHPGAYLFAPYAYPNGATVPGSLIPYDMGLPYDIYGGSPTDKLGKIPSPHPGPLSSLMMYNSEHIAQPPPAHMGIPPVHIDPKTGLPRPHMYAIPPHPGQFPHHLYSPEFTQMQWSSPPGYPISAGFRGPYPTSLTSSALSRLSPPGMLPHHPGLPHPGIPHPAIITPGPKQEIHPSQENHRPESAHQYPNGIDQKESERKRAYVKKPLNAFMLFMKEMRQKVVDECTLKESAAINQILGRKWHALDRSEQSKYYDMARKEKELHQQLYPGWSARDNYATHNKKKKRKRESTPMSHSMGGGGIMMPIGDNRSSGEEMYCSSAKKCRARFGVDAQNQWCKPCRSDSPKMMIDHIPSAVETTTRKKRCIRFMGEDGDEDDDDDDDDSVLNSGSVATVDSTTDGDRSDFGSPAPSSTHTEEGVQHPLISQSAPSFKDGVLKSLSDRPLSSLTDKSETQSFPHRPRSHQSEFVSHEPRPKSHQSEFVSHEPRPKSHQSEDLQSPVPPSLADSTSSVAAVTSAATTVLVS